MAFDTFDLFTTSDHIFIVPAADDVGKVNVSASTLVIDRITNDVRVSGQDDAVPLQAEKTRIYGVIGIIHLVSGPHLLVITGRELVGEIGGHKIWRMSQAKTIAYARTTMHLTEKEVWYNRHFVDMIELVLNTDSFYFSNTYDLTHSLQRLEYTTAEFKQLPMHERADERFLWNKFVLQDIANQTELYPFITPILHGFCGIRKCRLSDPAGTTFKLVVVSRRSIHRVGPRFCVRGLNVNGHTANFVETEQILEYETVGADGKPVTHMCSVVQIRGSIPLLWKQSCNLRWQPQPELTADDSTQTLAFRRHFDQQMLHYQNNPIVIVDLVNQKGREKAVGSKLKQIAESSKLPNVSYYAFDFHKHCKGLNWDKMSILQNDLAPSVKKFGFFYSTLGGSHKQLQNGYFRTNCMDCLDRTNVVQSLLAKTCLILQLQMLKVLGDNETLTGHAGFDTVFKNLWADNGDSCSVQYSGTGALKADFTRFGKRTVMGGLADLQNAITRYFRNNFADGYKQDALDIFLGYYVVDRSNLPASLATGPVDSRDWRAGVCLLALFSVAAALLCIFAVSEAALQWFAFWLLVLLACLLVMFINGPEFVNAPKLHQD